MGLGEPDHQGEKGGCKGLTGGLGGTCIHEMKAEHDQTFHHVVPATLTTDTKRERERDQSIIAMYLQYYTEKKRGPHLCSTVLSTHLSRSGDSPDTAVQVYTVPLDCTGMTEIVTGRLTLYPSGGSAAILVFEVLQNGTLEAIKHLYIYTR